MKKIINGAQAKEIDRVSIEDLGIPSCILMEKAAMAVASCIMSSINRRTDRVLAVCGTGNNGGDAVAAARQLWESGINAIILVLGTKEQCSPDMIKQLQMASNLDMTIFWDDMSTKELCPNYIGLTQTPFTEKRWGEYTIIIDGIFGIGLSREITGKYISWIDWINSAFHDVVSVDIPSGVNATDGSIMGKAVKAGTTVTFGQNKCGLLLYPGATNAGQVIVADIGFPRKAVRSVGTKIFTYEESDVPDLIPSRKPHSNKGTYGKTLIIAGSPTMSGACYFAAEAAYRMGCGIVHVITAEENVSVIRNKVPEAIISSWSEGIKPEERRDILDALVGASSIVIGPGLGKSEEAKTLLELVINYGKRAGDKPIIMDADAINLYAEMYDVLNLPSCFVLTPHLKEMSRLLHSNVNDISNQLLNVVKEGYGGCTLVLKDSRTLVSDGSYVYINTSGNNAMATGGSGDVLSGMIGGLLAGDVSIFDGVTSAVYLHGLTADCYIQDHAPHTMLARDILAMIPKVFQIK